ncbi:MAG: 50S ribosomal protein L17 [Candidatus Saccharibacteria bacterium]
MHRHGYKGTKFHRERDQREALIESLAEALIKYEAIETTLPKAKTVVPYVEKLITKAKKGDLHNRRQIIQSLQTIETAHKLFDDITPKLSSRNSGYFRIERTVMRRGDNAQMARVSFVDDLSAAAVAKAAVTTKAEPAKTKPAVKAPAKKPAAKAKAGVK